MSVSVPTKLVFGAVGAAAAMLVAGAVVTLSTAPANALPKYAADTHLPCGKCHVSPAGGGAQTDFGKAFAANGHKVPK